MAEPLTIAPRAGLGIATIMARKGVDRHAVAERLGFPLPQTPATASGEGLLLVGTGPGSWLALREQADAGFAENMRDRLAGIASVSDQSSAYSIHRLTGTGARRVLQRGASIDLDPSVFTTGSAATTVIAHIGVIFWQVDDVPGYDVATFRSYEASFRHWLDGAAAVLEAS